MACKIETIREIAATVVLSEAEDNVSRGGGLSAAMQSTTRTEEGDINAVFEQTLKRLSGDLDGTKDQDTLDLEERDACEDLVVFVKDKPIFFLM